MRRAASILIGILLGALAAGLGTGIFLKKANEDRARLAKAIETTVEQATQARSENTKAIEDANAKLNAANLEVAKAQALIKALQEEQAALATATVLPAPAARTVRGWSDVVNLDLGVSLKIPPTLVQGPRSATEITATLKSGSISDPRALSIARYSATQEQELLASLVNPSAVSFVINGRLVTGSKGSLQGQSTPLYVLRVRHEGVTTHLIWIRDISQGIEATTILGTLTFAS